MSVFTEWDDHTFPVKTLAGQDEWGASTFADATITGGVDHTAVKVISSDGTEVLSGATIYAPLSELSKVPPGSIVTLPEREATVITVTWVDDGDPHLDGITVRLT